MIRVALVDDQPLVRVGFQMVINSQDDMEVVGEASDGAEAITRIAALNPDVVLMDIRMPQIDGITATKEISESNPDTKIIILTTFDLDEYVLGAVRAGAAGFLLKDVQPEEMLSAIRTVHAGDAVIAPSSTKRLLDHVAGTLPVDTSIANEISSDLTERELEVLKLMAKAKSNAEIAEDLFISEATVKTHVAKLLQKLGVRDRLQAVVLAYETGLVHPNGK